MLSLYNVPKSGNHHFKASLISSPASLPLFSRFKVTSGIIYFVLSLWPLSLFSLSSWRENSFRTSETLSYCPYQEAQNKCILIQRGKLRSREITLLGNYNFSHLLSTLHMCQTLLLSISHIRTHFILPTNPSGRLPSHRLLQTDSETSPNSHS